MEKQIINDTVMPIKTGGMMFPSHRFVQISIVTFLLILFSGIVIFLLCKNAQLKNVLKQYQQTSTTAPVLNEPQTLSIEDQQRALHTSQEFRLQNYIDNTFWEKYPYPAEMNINEIGYSQFRCLRGMRSDGRWKIEAPFENEKRIEDEKLISQNFGENENITLMNYCEAKNGYTFILYNDYPVFFNLAMIENNKIDMIAHIRTDRVANTTCKALAVSKDDNAIYVECEGGGYSNIIINPSKDEAIAGRYIYRVDVEKKTHTLIQWCQREALASKDISCLLQDL